VLAEVAIGSQQVRCCWWEGGQISVQGNLEHVDESGRVHSYDGAAYSGPPLLLHRLIQKRVVMLEVQPMRLTLGFEGGQQLRLLAEAGRGECGVIQFTDKLEDGWIVY